MKDADLPIVQRENKVDVNNKTNHIWSQSGGSQRDRHRTKPEAEGETGIVPYP